MQFLVEVERLGDDWRLQADGSWRSITLDQLVRESDLRIDNLAELTAWKRGDIDVTLDGKQVKANPTDMVLIRDLYVIRFRAVRAKEPRTPTMEELRQVIAAGNDRFTNTLVIDLDGHFKLKRWLDGERPIKDLDIAVRMETFSAHNDYVGPEAAMDSGYLGRLYKDYIWLWNRHLETGRMNIFADATPA